MASRLVSLIILVAVVVAVVGTVAHSASTPPACVLTDKIPVPPADEPAPIDSDDEDALVSFFGYLEYNTTSANKYLPLKLKHVWTGHVDDKASTPIIVLEADCADIEYGLVTKDGTINWRWQSIWLKALSQGTDICSAGVSDTSFPKGEYYSCDKGSYACQFPMDNVQVTVVTLKIVHIKMEVGRDVHKTTSGKFSQKEHKCSL